MISFTRILVRLWIRDPDFRSLVLLVFLTLLIGTTRLTHSPLSALWVPLSLLFVGLSCSFRGCQDTVHDTHPRLC